MADCNPQSLPESTKRTPAALMIRLNKNRVASNSPTMEIPNSKGTGIQFLLAEEDL